ncbi:MAG: phage holin [Eubacteriales bacterium]|nr:phage holin [Eubacteriales bacterium]
MTNITTGTIIRTVVLLIALLNQLLTATGHAVLPIEDEQVAEIISTGATIITAMMAWWKNNSFTEEAITADEMMNTLKKQRD